MKKNCRVLSRALEISKRNRVVLLRATEPMQVVNVEMKDTAHEKVV